ncbi:anthranilate 1,2-dioxygenase regulatory protein AndR [Paraburkholderia sediminicola]|uniref:anthranilate 1,2-dioxygenase regulatory protein AndR n=1 Tax=Paraburkholderia sediminicola TaxID=458836 RepID=UPI0038B7FEF8
MLTSPFSAPALREFRLFESADLDETRERISRVMQPHLLVPSGAKAGLSHMDFVRLGGVGIGTIAFGTAMRVDVEAVDGYHLLMFCVTGQAKVRTRGRTVCVDQSNAVLCAAGEPFDAVLSPDCEQFILRIDTGLPGTQAWSARLGPGSHIHVDSPALGGWMQQLNLIANSSALLDLARKNDGVGRQLGRLLLELLTPGHATVAPEPNRRTASPGFVKRAEDFMHEHCGEVLRLPDIAMALGLAERTLRDGFQQFRGISPTQYLRQIRLDKAHEILREATADVYVSDVAMDCGLMHLGRFSIEYKKRFGESPSDTLARRM